LLSHALAGICCSQEGIKEEGSQFTNLESSGITITSLCSDLNNINGVPKILDADTTSSDDNLNILLPVLPFDQLGQFVPEMSEVTSGEDLVSSLGEICDGNTEFVEFVWVVESRVLIDGKS